MSLWRRVGGILSGPRPPLESRPELNMAASQPSRFGSSDLALPDNLREPLLAHLANLKERYLARGWGERVGFGQRPALIVIDLALFWTQPQHQIGTDAEAVVNASCEVLAAAREAKIPVFFTSFAYDPADPP